MRPVGVVSKNDMGSLSTLSSMLECMRVAALRLRLDMITVYDATSTAGEAKPSHVKGLSM